MDRLAREGVRYSDLTGMNELYDLDSDPYEEHNLNASPAVCAPLTTQGELERLTRASAPPPPSSP